MRKNLRVFLLLNAPFSLASQPNSVRFEHSGSDPKTAIETYTFDWPTEAACTDPPPPPCTDCVCAGVDLSSLVDSFEATGLSYIDDEGKLCDPSEQPAPASPALAATVPVPTAAPRAANGAEPCADYTSLVDLWRSSAAPAGNHRCEFFSALPAARSCSFPLTKSLVLTPRPHSRRSQRCEHAGWLVSLLWGKR